MKTKIFAVCEELQKSGVKPTLERVREALGGGSFSTINPILKLDVQVFNFFIQPLDNIMKESILIDLNLFPPYVYQKALTEKHLQQVSLTL